MRTKLESLEKVLGFKIHNPSYFIKAITHRSYLELNPDLEKSNERLEFLGDSVLNMIVAKYLFKIYSNEEEGFLTKVRSSLVNKDRLYITAEKLQLNNYVMYNHRYLGNSLEGLKTILVDCLEAIIGATYLDQGIDATEIFILENLIYPNEEDRSFLIDNNYKGQLLEFTHSKKMDVPRYHVTSIDGPEHKREFTIDVYIGNKAYGSGKGSSKKAAEQDASRIALSKLKSNYHRKIS
jgi:ribonuclease-3